MAANPTSVFSQVLTASALKLDPFPGQGPFQACICSILALTVLIGFVQVVEGADPYAAALDKRFEPASAEAPSAESSRAAFEEGLKRQIRQMSHRPEPVAPPAESGVQPW